MKNSLADFVCLLLVVVFAVPVSAQYADWKQSGSIFILTTSEGADLPASVSVEQFPLLVRLHKESFDFRLAKADGSDVRFASADGAALPYQIEEWDAARGEAAVWVRVPKIHGNSRQELRVFWGQPDAKSESSGAAVFGESNGFVSVWHLGDTIVDDVGTLMSQDVGSTAVRGMIGNGRHLHSTEAWFRAERPNSTIIGWGNEGGGRGSKVRMQFRSPPHVHVDSDFSDVDAPSRLPMREWIHVVHTYANGEGRIYINGRLDGAAKPTLNIKSPARLWLGGWYHNYDFVGDLDEVRVSKVARSADWVRLEYENQKPMQTLVGPIVSNGDAFSVSHSQLTVAEGTSATITAQAGGAQKLSWILKRDGRESVVAVDRLSFTFDAGRVVGDAIATLQFRAVYPGEVKTKDIAITIQESIAEPVFALKAPTAWDGREPIDVTPAIANLSAMQAQGAGELRYRWSVSGPAVIKESVPGKLILKRAMGSGSLVVTLALSNGGAATTHSVTIAVTEPPRDAWVQRDPNADERPVDGQFYARDDSGFGTLVCNGTLAEPAESVFLRVFEGDKLIASETQKPSSRNPKRQRGPEKSYAFSVRLKPGLIKYRIEFGTGDKILHAASNLVCGDAFLIIGQSNAVATDFGKDAEPPPINDWVRTFGATDGGPQGSRLKLWAAAQARNKGGKSEIGYWGMELGRRLVESQVVPICLINGAVGGTRIDQHQRNVADPTDAATIYGRLLWRVREAGLTHGIRGILWHQGENDQGADGPTGGFGWETYREYFHELAASWKQDYPNLQHVHLFQIWPKSCAMGINGSDNRLREVQRTLPRDFSRLSIMSTLGIRPPGGCHFPAAGYAEFARLLVPLIERDHYGQQFTENITPPNLLRAAFINDKRDELALEFDQPVIWTDKLASQFYLDGTTGLVTDGRVEGNTLVLRLNASSTSKQVAYLDSKSWNQDNLLVGTNGIAALTFCEVPIVAK
ncbi:MAG: hypothetical protein FD138_1139 [Planctomycetota bacterium]|nr:MAG: hypothetical protein FD138_1139 [Planctomycetota bacterium]